MRLPPQQLDLSRIRPQRTDLNLFIFQPREVMKCRIDNLAIAKGARTIKFDTVSLGSYLDAKEGMTVFVGSYEGGSDVGKVRLRSCIVNSMVVAENSDIKWEDGLYLTVIRYWEPWAIFPRIIQDPAKIEHVIFYKDYDIPHTTQNNTLGTYLSMGTHQGVLLESGTGTVFYTATGSLNLVGAPIRYDWEFEGGYPTGSTNVTPGNIYYYTPGDYVTRLTATTVNGSADTGYRYVSVKNKIGEGSQTPVVLWNAQNISGSRGEAGYTVDITIYDHIENVVDNSVVIITSEDWYGATKTLLGGNRQGSEGVFYVGYIDKGSIRFSANKKTASFTATSITGIMKRTTGFSVSVESKPLATKWFQLNDMCISRAIYHYLRWHSTVLGLADFEFRGEDRKIQYYDADRGSIFDAVDSLLKGALIGSLCADRQGKLWAETEPRAYLDPTGTFTPVMSIGRGDWMNEPSIEERIYGDSSYVEMGGVAYSGAMTGTFKALLADAPGGAPANVGNVDSITGLALTGQTPLNQMVGHIWANKNSPYPTVDMDMSTMCKNLDIAPYEAVQIEIHPEDTNKNIYLDGLYLPASISWTYNSRDGILAPNIEFQQLVNGNPGDTIIITNKPAPDFDFPEIDFPPFPVPIPDLVIYDPTTVDNVVIAVKDNGIYYTNDFSSPYPTWYSSNLALPGVNGTVALEVSNSGKLFLQYGTDSIWISSAPGGVWSKLFDTTMIGNPGNYPFPRDWEVSGFGIDRNADDSIIILGSLIVTIFGETSLHAFAGDSGGVNLVPGSQYSINFKMAGASRKAFITRGTGGWLVTYYNAYLHGISAFIDDSASVLWEWNGVAYNTAIHTRARQSSSVAVNLYNPYITFDNGANFVEITGSSGRFGLSDGDEFQSIITNTNGTQIVVGTAGVAIPTGLMYSIDNGALWVTGAFLPEGVVTSVWHISESAYIIADVADAGYTSIAAIYDLTSVTGAYAIDKTGNLRDLITGTFYPTIIRHY